MDKIITTPIPAENFELQTISPADNTLIANQEVEVLLNTATDTVEYYLYDQNELLLTEDYNYVQWRTDSESTATNTENTLKTVDLDPEADVLAELPSTGKYFAYYTFVRNKFLSSTNSRFYIDSISGDRKEIVVKTNNLSQEELTSLTEDFLTEVNNSTYFEEFYLNFGENQSVIGLDLRQVGDTLQIKLYLPLPVDFQEKSNFWIQLRVADPVAYEVDYTKVIIPIDTTIQLKGPNLNVQRKKDASSSTEYKSQAELNFTYLTGSKSQLNSLLQEKGIELNIDYTDYSNFVNFSSATQRLENFYYKVKLIESGSNRINQITGSSMPATQQSQSIAILQADIDRIITNFDGYDYYLYYESGSKAWPKTNSTKPYTLASTGSAEVISWYGTAGLDGTGQLQSASVYDNENQDNLVYSIPEYIREDSDNAPYELFIEMIGQHFDNLYLYTQAITEKYNADNRLDYGVSKDLVADTLRSFGVKLYENNFSTDDLYTALLGLTPSGSTLPLPNISTTLPVTGSGIEYVETIVSASNEVIPLDDLNKSIYKRLYHNLPALVKKKGTLAGLRLLINAYGIPDTVLRISEFGGKDKDNSNDWDYWQREYSKKADFNGTDQALKAFWSLNPDWNSPDDFASTVAFRFKTEEVTPSTGPTNASQSIWAMENTLGGTTYMNTVLTYTGSAGTSGSYSGSIVDPYYQYGTLTFFPDYADTTQSASVYLPFYDGGWWSVMINRSASVYNVYAKNSIYNGETGTELGFQGSASLNALTSNWTSSKTGRWSFIGDSMDTYSKFSGSIQEFRYYTTVISESVFDDFVMNPNSIEGNSINSAPNELAFRAALGGELYTASFSIHPKASGQNQTASFGFGLDNGFETTASFSDNTQIAFYDQPAVGIRNRISDKIRLDDNGIYGTTLSNQRSLVQNTPATKKYTRDTNYLEVGFSPQNEINDDIIDQIGYFNIGDYIGDVRQIMSSSYTYPDLDALRLDYFKKYSQSYDLNDYLRLIKFYDNSLFKMVKDFIPARTGAATGAIIKPTLLERNRQRAAAASWTRPEYSASIKAQARDYETGSIEVFTGGPGGSVNDWIDINQSWTSSILTPKGLVTNLESSEREFYNGEYSGSVIDVVNGKLQDNPLLGEAYRVSIPDLQNLNAEFASTINSITASLGVPATGKLPFTLETPAIDYYDNSTFEYTPAFDVVVDLELFITGVFVNTTSIEDSQLTIYLKENGNIIDTSFDDNGNDDILINRITRNFELKSGSVYTAEYLYVENDNPSNSTARLTTASYWRVNVQNLSAGSTYYLDPTVYAQQNFPGNLNEFSDYNAIYNNVYSNRVSTKYFDVDYTNGALNPSNFGPIISQSALYAQIQDSNYDNKSAFFEARFGGTKNTGEYNFTELIAPQSITTDYPVDYFTPFFAYFDWVGGSNPQYPGGGNVHCTYLINAETGDIFSLSQENKYVNSMSQIFKKDDTVYMLPISASSGNQLYSSTIVEGAARYDTILYRSGSSEEVAFYANYEGGIAAMPGYSASLTYGAVGTDRVLSDKNDFGGGSNAGWIYALQTVTSSLGSLIASASYSIPTGSNFGIYNKRTNQYLIASNALYQQGALSSSIAREDTYLPLQNGDFIRFGYDDGTPFGMDDSFNPQRKNLVSIINIETGSDYQETSSINITPGMPTIPYGPSISNHQNLRIFRRIPDETFTLVDALGYTGAGLLIPKNFNPKYDPIKIAKEQNII